MFARFIPSLECETNMPYMPSVGICDQYLREIMRYEAYVQERSTLFPTSEPVLKVWKQFGLVEPWKRG